MPKGMSVKVRERIDRAAAIAAEIHPTTVRGVGYKMFVAGDIPDMSKSSTAKVSRALVTAREQGVIPWSWIVDEHRELETVQSWADPASYAETVREAYRRDCWQEQAVRLVVVSEKGTMRGVLKPILDDYGVSFLVVHGFASATVAYDLAKQSRADARPLVLVYVGDFDTSGRFMSDVDLPERISEYGGYITMRRVALTDDDRQRLPDFPAKRQDPRFAWYVEGYGHRCCELDALDANELRTRVETELRSWINWETWNRAESTEAAELASLNDVLTTWNGLFLDKTQNSIGGAP
jgi:hypothetical protein